MGRKAAVGLLVAAFVLLAGCKAPMLRELDADMPSAIVEQYAQSDKPYVDRGLFWLPGFTALGMHVSKTADGYHATGNFAMGPLGTLIVGRQSSDFNAEGQLLRYSVHGHCLWGILLSDESCKQYVHDEWQEHWSRKIFFGLLGYEGDSDHWRAFYFLFIPIVTSHGRDHHWRPMHEMRIERDNDREESREREHEERMPEPPERHHT